MNKLTLLGVILIIIGVILFVLDSTVAPTLIKPSVSGSTVIPSKGEFRLSLAGSSITTVLYNSSGTLQLENLPNTSVKENLSQGHLVTVENLNSTPNYIVFYNPNSYNVTLTYKESTVNIGQAATIGILFIVSIALFIVGVVIAIYGFIRGRRRA